MTAGDNRLARLRTLASLISPLREEALLCAGNTMQQAILMAACKAVAERVVDLYLELRREGLLS